MRRGLGMDRSILVQVEGRDPRRRLRLGVETRDRRQVRGAEESRPHRVAQDAIQIGSEQEPHESFAVRREIRLRNAKAEAVFDLGVDPGRETSDVARELVRYERPMPGVVTHRVGHEDRRGPTTLGSRSRRIPDHRVGRRERELEECRAGEVAERHVDLLEKPIGHRPHGNVLTRRSRRRGQSDLLN
ncbi:MAG: hypothetical protein ACRD21_08400, partial [Vicinamibacteria bacterium]